MKHGITLFLTLVSTALCVPFFAEMPRGNTTNESYVQAKKTLDRRVYFDHRVTLYCAATFDRHRTVKLPKGFKAPSDKKRARRLEWEHVIPAQWFGREFDAWKYGSFECTDGAGRGRQCAERVSREFRLMHADMYNLFPAIGAVNRIRSNYPYTEFPEFIPATFGSCPMKVYRKKVEPPAFARGEISRAALYMQWAYPERVKLSRTMSEMMTRWNETYPVSAWECLRSRRIEALQGNENPFVKEPCRRAKLW